MSRILSLLGYPVYDSDSRAKALMDSSLEIKNRIAAEVAAEAIVDNEIRRDILAEVVFGNPDKLLALNNIVHHHVRRDILREAASSSEGVLFVETAILYESGIDRMVSQVWEVTAPEQIRIERVMQRNHCSREQAIARIESQRFTPEHPHHSVHPIINDGLTPVLPRVLHLLRNI